MPWPSTENEPLNEYQISHLATMAFPTLFPDGKGDPTNQGLLRDVPLQERIKHLLKFAEIIEGKWVYRFANHPRFSYWAFNMIQRKRILQQSGYFLNKTQVKHISQLMNCEKWHPVIVLIYLCQRCLDMLAILRAQMLTGIE